MKLPKLCRPNNVAHRRFQSGVDLPSWFFDGLQSIDSKLFLVWHPYKILWDDVMNVYTGALDDPRFNIHQEYGEEIWGWVLKANDGAPLREGKWHVWRLSDPYGWCHVLPIDCKEESWLSLVLRRLNFQGRFRDKYGDIKWNRRTREDQERLQEEKQKDQTELFSLVQDENRWLMKKAMDNFDHNIVKPTNPVREIITSYRGQGNKTKIVRPLTDEEGGLFTLAGK